MPQRDEQFLRTASLDAVREAYAANELTDLLQAVPAGQVGPGTLRTMKPEQIAEAHAAGKLAHLLGATASSTD